MSELKNKLMQNEKIKTSFDLDQRLLNLVKIRYGLKDQLKKAEEELKSVLSLAQDFLHEQDMLIVEVGSTSATDINIVRGNLGLVVSKELNNEQATSNT